MRHGSSVLDEDPGNLSLSPQGDRNVDGAALVWWEAPDAMQVLQSDDVRDI
jgi:hypothetical protein